MTDVDETDAGVGPPVDPDDELRAAIRRVLTRARRSTGHGAQDAASDPTEELTEVFRAALVDQQDAIRAALEELAHENHPDNWPGDPADRLDHVTLRRISRRLHTRMLTHRVVSRPQEHHLPRWREWWSLLTGRPLVAACGAELTDHRRPGPECVWCSAGRSRFGFRRAR
ncbi:hypothetical protein [Saccharothrix sp. HUAS TT1]|uniref:hypothetical protein n=1 Tax=unclassified Saccharothrix TaxID=2593673 RepID=UPI00345C0F31